MVPYTYGRVAPSKEVHYHNREAETHVSFTKKPKALQQSGKNTND